jgi:sugar phosphate isomerase/epimerase
MDDKIYRLSISNIAWGAGHDREMYIFLQEQGFSGLEIAPTRVFPDSPYNKLSEAADFARALKENHGLSVSSIQSIWFGRTENIFGTETDRDALIQYTKKAVLFAKTIQCHNLVFGCPRNRNIPDALRRTEALRLAKLFFKTIASFAYEHGIVVALEPNPVIYHTNFINSTIEAVELIKELNNDGLRLNVDLGTILYNNEDLNVINDNIAIINHIHISEPNLDPVKENPKHFQLRDMLKSSNYQGFISIEMKSPGAIEKVKECALYIKEVFV